MPHWIALIPGLSPPSPSTEAAPLDAQSLAWWSLQFTPRVALLDEGVVAELQASHRLFGGPATLVQRITSEALTLGCQACAQANTASAALALARHAGPASLQWVWGQGPWAQRMASLVNALPLNSLTGIAPHAATLARLGCRTLRDVRALPRPGLSRRFGAGLLKALDQVDGLQAQAFEWQTLPAVFDARLELPGRVDTAPAMGEAASVLISRLCAWLAGHQAGVHAWTLRWQYDFFRQRDTSSVGECTVRLGTPSRDPLRLQRLMTEHLQRIELSGPVGDISLHAHDISALADDCRHMFPEISGEALSVRPDALTTPAAQKAQQEALLNLVERLSARLGPDQVLQGQMQADHRPEHAQSWHPTPHGLPTTAVPISAAAADLPQPCWLLTQPQALSLIKSKPGLPEHPYYQGQLRLLAGPHRIEAGWWDDTPTARDYYLASSERAGLLWIFRDRHPDPTHSLRSPWFLHGLFA